MLVSGEDLHAVHPMWKAPMAERQRWEETPKGAKQKFYDKGPSLEMATSISDMLFPKAPTSQY